MKEWPYQFGAEMVKAILAGKKTQTCGPVTEHTCILSPNGDWSKLCWDGSAVYREEGMPVFHPAYIVHKAPRPYADKSLPNWEYLHVPYDWGVDSKIYRIYPREELGDKIWVREAWWTQPANEGARIKELVDYAADLEDERRKEQKWRPSIFMPRWASRITLEITTIRFRRLQGITKSGVKAEGFPTRGYFKTYWDSRNAKRGYAWDQNLWVKVIGFKKEVKS